MSTVLQKAIDKHKKIVQNLYDLDRVAPEDSLLIRNTYRAMIAANKDVIVYLESLLPEEEEQIREAWEAANDYSDMVRNYRSGEYPSFETYITNLKK